MELTLKEYLIKFFGAKESFFEEGYYCKLNYKQGTVGFISSSLISKISLGKSFIPLDKVFPNKKKIELSFGSNPRDCRIEEFYSPNGTFKEAIKKFDKYYIDLKHDDLEDDDFDNEKLLKKNGLKEFALMNGSYTSLDKLFGKFCEVYFHHDYKTSYEWNGNYNLNRQNYFLIKKGKKIYYVHTESLFCAGWIDIKI